MATGWLLNRFCKSPLYLWVCRQRSRTLSEWRIAIALVTEGFVVTRQEGMSDAANVRLSSLRDGRSQTLLLWESTGASSYWHDGDGRLQEENWRSMLLASNSDNSLLDPKDIIIFQDKNRTLWMAPESLHDVVCRWAYSIGSRRNHLARDEVDYDNFR